MSAYEKTGNWKSPRKVEEEIRDYHRRRFEKHMVRVDRGEISRALAIAALREEIDGTVYLDDEGHLDCPTAPIDSTELRELLDEG